MCHDITAHKSYLNKHHYKIHHSHFDEKGAVNSSLTSTREIKETPLSDVMTLKYVIK